jgi:GNAT superfamily N-acetyltransferase
MALPSAAAPVLDAAIVHEKPCAATDKPASTADHKSTTTPNHDGVRIVAPHEYREAAACLAEAFRTDDVVRYAIDTPDREHLSEEERYELHRAALEYVTYAHCLQGLVLTVGDNYDCVALWLPPGKNIDDWMTILRSGMWRLNYKLSREGKARFFDEFLPLLHESKQEILGERDGRSWYLNYVGTKREARGKGYAKKAIQYVTSLVSGRSWKEGKFRGLTMQADAHGIPCYLESSHDINVLIYGKMGFEVKKQIHLKRAPGKELRMDVMVREPIPLQEKNAAVGAAQSA